VEMLVERAETFATSFQKGRPEKFDSSASHCAGLRVILNGFEGYSYSENLSEEALMASYQEAFKNAEFTGQAGESTRKAQLLDNTATVSENPTLVNDSLSQLDVPAKLERAKTIEATALSADPRIAAVPYNGYTETQSEVQILNSRGVRRRQRKTSVVGYAYCLAKSGEESKMGGEGFFTRQSSKFDPVHVAKVAAEKAVAKLGSDQPETGMYPIVIDAEVASEFLGLFIDSFSAKSVEEKTSLFGTDLGQVIASPILTMVDDPFFDGMGTRAFDSEGSPVQVTPLVEAGKLSNFLTNSVIAKRMKLPHTSSAARSARSQLDIGISNLIVKQGTETLEQLLAKYPKVIYITDFTGYHAGYSGGSGDFSLQSEGELWENGKRVKPLANFVTSGNVKQVLKSIEALSNRRLPPMSSVV
ncbi:MAG: TldD/PmbA family protein, partial [Proteobacteria bacterium]